MAQLPGGWPGRTAQLDRLGHRAVPDFSARAFYAAQRNSVAGHNGIGQRDAQLTEARHTAHYDAGNSPVLAWCKRLAFLVMATDERTDPRESQCNTRRFSHQLA